MTAKHIPTEEEVLSYMTSLSNWGRWGADDELGTLNLITPEKRAQAARLVQEGTSVTCSSATPFRARFARRNMEKRGSASTAITRTPGKSFARARLSSPRFAPTSRTTSPGSRS